MAVARRRKSAKEPSASAPEGLPELLNVTQVAAYLGLHRVTVLEFARRGKLPGLKVGREWRFRAEDIRAWLEEQRKAGDTFAQRFDELWERLRQGAQESDYGREDIPRLIEEVRRARRRAASRA
jgi:excisionase family DNA binding protein